MLTLMLLINWASAFPLFVSCGIWPSSKSNCDIHLCQLGFLLLKYSYHGIALKKSISHCCCDIGCMRSCLLKTASCKIVMMKTITMIVTMKTVISISTIQSITNEMRLSLIPVKFKTTTNFYSNVYSKLWHKCGMNLSTAKHQKINSKSSLF